MVKMKTWIKSSLPYQTIFILILIWLFTAAVNALLIKSGFHTGTTVFFPISIFHGPVFHWNGLPYAILFIALSYTALKYSPRMTCLWIWAAGLSLIVAGNLMQGGIEKAFIEPFTSSDIQYYHDAITVKNCNSFLGSFNDIQATLQDHSRTHPPFAVLLHYGILKASNGSIGVISTVFILLSSLTLIVIWHTVRQLGGTTSRAAQFVILFSVVPAFNIYSAVSLDGIIVLFSALWILGAVLILTNRHTIGGMSLVISGIVLMNVLTFLGIFLIAVTSLIAAREVIIHRKYWFVSACGIAIAAGIMLCFTFRFVYAYDHFRALMTASHLENPGGFLGITAPLTYIMTRLEDIYEIALFLSFGLLGIIFSPYHLRVKLSDIRDDMSALFQAGIITLLLMFLVGAFKTGETARTCLFIYPFFLPALRSVNDETLRSSIIFAGLQTMIMQLCGSYFW